MKITVHNQSKSFERSFDLVSPGLTIGRSPENHIALADPSLSISLFQAAITIDDAAQISIRNLALTPILVGNHSLKVGETMVLKSDSEFSCGDFYFNISVTESNSLAPQVPPAQQATQRPLKAPTVMPMPGTVEMPTATHHLAPNPVAVAPLAEIINLSPQQPASEQNTVFEPLVEATTELRSDIEPSPTPFTELGTATQLASESAADNSASIFDSLFDGAGVVPVGASDINYDIHPFDMTSGTVRNSHDPLAELQGIALDDNLSKDPLERLSRDGIEHQKKDILQDQRPSTLLHANEQELTSNHATLDHLDTILLELAQQKRLGQ